MGIPKYNAECRAIVMRYSKDWEVVVKRMGRWIDMDNTYKTMDLSYMESVWWVFKQLFEKNLVYQGFKVMPYSTGCTTPLSNFEANMLYKEVNDPAGILSKWPNILGKLNTSYLVYVSFPLEGSEAALVAWTTTPWTLPSNLALCVNPDMEYVRLYGMTLLSMKSLPYCYFEDNQRKKEYIILEARVPALYKNPAKDVVIKEKFLGKTLAGKKYTPLFKYYEKVGAAPLTLSISQLFHQEAEKGAFVVLTDGYVTAESGTGVVHQAPLFGEDDFRVCTAAGILQKGKAVACPVDDNGCFTAEITDFAGKYIKVLFYLCILVALNVPTGCR